MKKRLIIVAVAIVAIIVLAYFAFGRKVVDKYTYGTDKADLAEFFGVSENEASIIYQNAKTADKAIVNNGVCYLSLENIEGYFGKGFYYSEAYNGGTLMYTTSQGTYETVLGSNEYTYAGEKGNYDYPITISDMGKIYVAAEFARKFFSFSYAVYDMHVQIVTDSWTYTEMEITGNTQIRVAGGIKSEILRDVEKGEKVELLDEMENWSKVMTSDSYIGYIENKKMEKLSQVATPAPAAVELPAFEDISIGKTVCLGFHAIGGVGGNDTIYEMVAEGTGMNVIAPTWFSMNDNEGNLRNFGTSNYVNIAHGMGLQVWGVVDNFNYALDNNKDIDEYEVLSDTNKRRNLEINIVNAAVNLNLDGINLDFEGLSSDCGPHYGQFIKELSVLTHAQGIILSVDNYVPFAYNEHYRIDVQGEYADYVLIMGYDEHYHGSGDPGSVASFDYVANGLDKTLEYAAPEKIINALPFYTIVWKNESGKITDSYLILANQSSYLSKIGVSYSWDESTCQNYAEWTSGGVTYQLWLEDEESITAKLNAMKARDIGGVAVWRLGYGTSSVWNLVKLYTES